MFSLPSRETQFPRSCSCTLRVGLDVIGTSYWHALKARMHRQIATPKPKLRRVKFDEVTARDRNELTPSAIIWAASTRSRQFSRLKVILPKAQTLFPSRPARPCHSGGHPGQSHLRTCQKYRMWTARS